MVTQSIWVLLVLLAGFSIVHMVVSERVVDVKYSIKTLVGDGLTGFNGDGWIGVETRINQPIGLFYEEESGDLFFSDTFNHRVRVLRNMSGLVETLAGTGTQGYSGEGLLAVNSSLSRPYGLFVSNNKDIYIAGNTANRIHKISFEDKKLYTFAGTGTAGFNGDGLVANQTRFYQPLDVKIVNQQFIIADSYGNRIRMINGTTMMVKTIAGTGNATFNGDGFSPTFTNVNGPWGIALTSKNDMYLGCYSLIRYFDINSNIIKTVAGVNLNITHSGDGGLAKYATFSNLNGIAVSPLNGDIFIAETNYHAIRKISSATGIVSTIAGNGKSGYNGNYQDATNSTLNYPRAIITTNSGDVIFGDTNNNLIRSLTPVCPSGYIMDSLQTVCIEACYGILYNSSQVCGMNGICQTVDSCVCNSGYYGLDCSLPVCLKSENGECLNVTSGVIVENIETSQLSNKSVSISTNSSSSSPISILFPSDFANYIANQTTFSTISLLTAVTNGGGNLTSSDSITLSIASNIITISLALTNGNKISVSKLQNPIQISFQKPSFTGNLTCMFFDELSNEWKSEGVETRIDSTTVNCFTSHLTSFSVIDINLKKEIAKPKIESSSNNRTLSNNQLSDEAIIAISVSIAGSAIVCCVISLIILVVICMVRRKSKN